MSTSAPQAATTDGGEIACEYQELGGANVHSTESVLVVRIASDGAAGPAWTLERPSDTLDRCAALLEALGLSAAEVRARERWPLGSLLQSIAEQLVRRTGVPRLAPAPAPARSPEREFVLARDPAAPIRASCELAAKLLSACATPAPTHEEHDRPRALLDEFDRRHPTQWPRAAARLRGLHAAR
jgi:hypothetical protein